MKVTKTFATVVAAISLIILLGSCCGCRSGKSRTAAALPGTNWKLTQLEGQTLNSQGDKYTLTFTTDNRINGVGDCNSIMGSYETTGTKGLKIHGAATTRMMCPDQQAEDRYVRRISSADSYAIEGGMLMLFENGETTMVFTKI